MCGIAGEYSFCQKADERSLHEMTKALTHRGPDEKGFFVKDNVGLGFRRLSIIDLYNGNQPIFNEDRNLCIIFNGEIYNYKELKKLLKNHVFRTRTDTEVILHLFEEYGPASFGMLNGMFSLAIYDIQKNVLYCARDRFGQKPFQYYCDKERFVFASEIKALRKHQNVISQINHASFPFYFFYNYIPAPHSVFKDIRKLPPQSYLTVSSKGIDVRQYDMPKEREELLAVKWEETVERTDLLLQKAVERHMIADVDVGIFLSGGIDSTVILKYAKRIKADIKTFSVTFDPHISEYKYIEEASSILNVSPFVIDVQPDPEEIVKIISSYSEPFGDSAIVPTYLISKFARESLKVVLTGEGGDEVFGGYDRYRKFFSKQVLTQSNGGFKSRYFNEITYCTLDHMKSCYNLDSTELEHHLNTREIGSLSDIILHEQKQRLPDNLFKKVDIATMANSLEARCPFLDHELVDFIGKIPIDYRLNSEKGKIILKRILSRDKFSDDFIDRPKWGFGAPVIPWMSKADIKEHIREIINEEQNNFSAIFKNGYASKIKNDFFAKRRDEITYEHWKIYTLLVWLRENRIKF